MNDQPIVPGGSTLVERAKAILLKPAEEWTKIAAESSSIGDVAKGYALPLILIGPIAMAIGLSVIGIDLGIMRLRLPVDTMISVLIASLIGAVLVLGILTFLAEFLAPQFGGTADRTKAFKLITYSMTATWLASILLILPNLGILVILAGLYGYYLVYLGAEPMMKVPKDKAVVYVLAILACGIVGSFIVNSIVMSIAMPSPADMLGLT